MVTVAPDGVSSSQRGPAGRRAITASLLTDAGSRWSVRAGAEAGAEAGAGAGCCSQHQCLVYGFISTRKAAR